MQVTEQVDTERAWVGTTVVAVAAFVLGSLLFPAQVYRGFVWHYFWGPVYADAHNALCAVNDGTVELFYTAAECQAASQQGLVVAEPGYTLVSEVGYMIILLFALVGVLQLVRRLRVGTDKRLVVALVPFMLFGGVLRVIEDANDAVPEGATQAISYPLNTLIISPFIYVTVFLVTVGSLLAAIWLHRNGYTAGYTRPLAVMGSVATLVTFGVLLWFALTTNYVEFHPQILVTVVAIASLLAGGLYLGVEQYAPEINAGTGILGLAVLWGHAIDGVANVVAADWLGVLGVNLNYVPKHPANAFIVSATESILPQSVLAVTGSSWPFLAVKLLVAVAVVWIFDADIMEDSPRYSLLLLVAIIAVGLGPGTRDVVRATFGI